MGYAREALGLGRILAIATADNVRSRNLLEKLGFVREHAVAFDGNAKDVVDVWAHG